MQNTRKEILLYIENILVIVIGITVFLFPLLFTSQFTDFFTLPKQVLLALSVSLSLLLLGMRIIVLRKVNLRSTPFDLPIFLFTLICFLSAIFAVNRYDALINFVPLLFSVLFYFIIVNSLRRENAILFIISALIAGGTIAGLISFLSYFRIYIFPYPYTQSQAFTTIGSLLDQAIYIAILLPFAGYIAWPFIQTILQSKSVSRAIREGGIKIGYGIGFGAATILLFLGLGISLFMLLTIAKPIILPFETGFQTAFASISQDAGRVLKSFLLGSGYGTYLTDFTRYKQPSYNLNPTLWSFTFFRSSSFVLELIATTGILGLLSFMFIAYRFIKEKSLFLPVILLFIASLVLPFSFTIQTLFFIVLGLFAATQALSHPQRYEDLEFYFVTMKKGLIAAVPESERAPANTFQTRFLPFLAASLILLLVASLSYLSGRYILSDLALQRSLKGLQQSLNNPSQANSQQIYKDQIEAINLFPYRDTNRRIFSQTNLALANSLAASQPKDKQVSQNIQQAILNLIQEAITQGRYAITLSPQTALNWNNLSDIYRALIGFGQNADQFAIITNQEAIRLDPANPLQYINLGGIFYQIGQYDQAQNQFQIAIQLKPDFANAYYNLGHALESKGDLQGALTQYQVVRTLVQSDPNSLKKINEEIAAIEKRIGEQARPTNQVSGTAQNQPPLNINRPEKQLPERKPEVKIEGPTPPNASPTPTPTGSVSPSPQTTTPTP